MEKKQPYETPSDLPYRTQRRIELPRTDVLDISSQLLEAAESLKQIAKPDSIEKTAYSIPLTNGSQTDLDLSQRIWSRYNTLSTVFTDNQLDGVRMRLQLQTSQKYDHTTIRLEDYNDWSVTPHDANTPINIITHAELLQLLGAKVAHNQGMTQLLQNHGAFTSDEFAYSLIDQLETLANVRTDRRVYSAIEAQLNDAYSSTIHAAITYTEGPEAIDYRISIGADGIPVKHSRDKDESHFTNIYEHTFSVPHETGVIEDNVTTFTVIADPSVDKKYVNTLARTPDAKHKAGDLLRHAVQMVADNHLSTSRIR